MAPLSGFLVVILIVVLIFRWWTPRSAVVLPALMAILNMIFGDHSAVSSTMCVYLMVGNILVGFNEEATARGQLLVALRSKLGETGVGSSPPSCSLLLHLPNAFFGIASLAILQVLIQFGLGSVYYLARRCSGSLVPAMILHGLWDFSAFSSNMPCAGLAAPFMGVAAVVAVLVILGRDKRRV